MSIDQVVAPTGVVSVQNGVPVNEPASAAGDAAATVRHEAPIGLAHAHLKLPLGSLALSSSPSGIREAGLPRLSASLVRRRTSRLPPER